MRRQDTRGAKVCIRALHASEQHTFNRFAVQLVNAKWSVAVDAEVWCHIAVLSFCSKVDEVAQRLGGIDCRSDGRLLGVQLRSDLRKPRPGVMLLLATTKWESAFLRLSTVGHPI